MADDSRKKLRRVTIVFWVLFFYIIAALAWWLISLEEQNDTIHALYRQQVPESNSLEERSIAFKKIHQAQLRESIKYLAEGITFFLLIIFGAVYIYRLVRRQFKLQQQQQNFVMAVTHELKTPLSVARLNLETMQKHQLDEPNRRQMLQTSLDETLRLDTLINNILISSELEGGAYQVSKERLDLSDLVRSVATEFQKRHDSRILDVQIEEGIETEGDPLLLKLLLSNLLENAQKYSEKDKPIRLVLKQDGAPSLSVIDEGVGIPEEEKKKIFDKFYRVGNEKTRRSKGTGLGLYICHKIAQNHGARIIVTDNRPAGTNFTVNFPK